MTTPFKPTDATAEYVLQKSPSGAGTWSDVVHDIENSAYIPTSGDAGYDFRVECRANRTGYLEGKLQSNTIAVLATVPVIITGAMTITPSATPLVPGGTITLGTQPTGFTPSGATPTYTFQKKPVSGGTWSAVGHNLVSGPYTVQAGDVGYEFRHHCSAAATNYTTNTADSNTLTVEASLNYESYSFLRKTTSGSGTINVPLPAGCAVGTRLLYIQARAGTVLPGAYAGSESVTEIVQALVDQANAGYDINFRIGYVDVSSGMLSNGYMALPVGTYGTAMLVKFTSDAWTAHAISGTPTSGSNFNELLPDLGTAWETMNTTAGLAGDLVLHMVIMKTYGALTVGGTWTNNLPGAIPASIGAVMDGNFAFFSKKLASNGEATGANAYTSDGPDNAFSSCPIFIRAA